MNELRNTFKPEFLNRIDATIVFRSLTREEVYQICDLLMARVKSQLVEQQIELEMTTDAKDLLVEKGFDPSYGARPLRRTIQNLVEDPLAEGMLLGRFTPGSKVVLTRAGDDIELQAEGALTPELTAAEAES
jgi:ATP-dependent Clp protease ATP-binding subunit ClpC